MGSDADRRGTMLDRQQLLEMTKRMGRVITRTLAGNLYSGTGSLADLRGFETGTRGDIDPVDLL